MWIDDNPWVEHAGQYPDCGYLKLIKGEDFIFKCSKVKKSTAEEEKYYEKIDQEERKERQRIETEQANTELCDCKTCTVCGIKEKKVVFLPCTHFQTCTSCAPLFNQCIVCRENIACYLKIFT